MGTNSIVHFDICGPNYDDLGHFYSNVLGWSVKPQGPGYSLVETPMGLRGSLVETEEPKLSLGIEVDNVEHMVATAVANGATLVMPPTDNGWVLKAEVSDPAGNRLTFIQGRAG